MSKTEEKLKDAIKEYLKDKEQILEAKLYSDYATILLTGIGIGVVLSYTSIVPLAIGGLVGYSIACKGPVVPITLDSLQNAWWAIKQLKTF